MTRIRRPLIHRLFARSCQAALLCVVAATVGSSLAHAQGLVYQDAADDLFSGPNLSTTDGSALSTILDPEPVSLEANNIWKWREFGSFNTLDNVASVYVAGGQGDEDVPEMIQTLTGLTSGTAYDVYVVYWTPLNADWNIRAGFTSNPGGNQLFNRTGADSGTPGSLAEFATWDTPPVGSSGTEFSQDNRFMYLGLVGEATATAAGEIDVYLDDLSTTAFPGGGSFTRTWLDGLAFVEAGTSVLITPGSFDGDDDVDAADFAIMQQNMFTDVSGLTTTQSYALGDVNRDLLINFDDFFEFNDLFDAANGPGAFAGLLAVPEPSSVAIFGIGGVMLMSLRRRCFNMKKPLLVAMLALAVVTANRAEAMQLGFYEFEGDLTDTLGNLADAFQSEGPHVGSGATFTNGNNGLVSDPVRGNVFDLSGGGIGGDGANGGVNLTLPVAGNQTGAWSLGMFMLSPPGTRGYLFDNRETATSVMPTGPDSLILNTGQNGGQSPSLSVFTGSWNVLGSPDLDDGEWKHIAWSYDGSVLTSYVDGVAGDTPAMVSILTDLLTNNIELGNEGAGGGAGGQEGRLIDEVRIFDEAITDWSPFIPQTVLDFVVDRTDGTTSLVNNLGNAVTFNFYQVESTGGSLDPSGWRSLDDTEGNPPGTGWTEAGGSTSTILGEGNAEGELTLNPGQTLLLDTLFDTSVGTEDLVFSYGVPGLVNLSQAVIEYVDDDGFNPGDVLGQDGDFDGDLDVDGADFLAWQRGEVPSTAQNLSLWRTNYGAPGSAAALATVPEPASLMLAGCAVVALTGLPRNRKAEAS